MAAKRPRFFEKIYDGDGSPGSLLRMVPMCLISQLSAAPPFTGALSSTMGECNGG